MPRAAHLVLISGVVLALLLGPTVPAARDRSGGLPSHVPAMATTDAGCGMDDMALWRGSPGDVARAKAPTRSPAVATLGRAMASTLPAGSPPPRAVTAIPDRIPLYDLHHVYRV